MAITTTKLTARILSSLLPRYGVKHAVLSPGSRNAPLIVALGRSPQLEALTVIDERSAAFVALGMAVESGAPVVIACTSGTALLNYAPAVAEAYYRHVPLIVVSADRPEQWIDRDDSQTIRQRGALSNIVKRSVHLSADLETVADGSWRANLLINEALSAATTGVPGPVHINIAFDTPLAETAEFPDSEGRYIPTLTAPAQLEKAQVAEVAATLRTAKTLIVCGFMAPDKARDRELARMAAQPNVAVIAESTANVHARGVIDAPALLFLETPGEEFVPDVVISCGGSLVNAELKTWLRRQPQSVEHWRIEQTDTFADTFAHLTRRFAVSEADFFRPVAYALSRRPATSGYAALWQKRYLSTDFANGKANNFFHALMDCIPNRWNVHFSNGMTIRRAQAYSCSRLRRCESNRGVSGIDGSVSTALGAALIYKDKPTVLLTGDMSLQYDLAALAASCLTPRLKIVVFDNGGGGIFREVAACRHLSEVEARFTASEAMSLPLPALAEAYGFDYFIVADIKDIYPTFRKFARESDAPAILHVIL